MEGPTLSVSASPAKVPSGAGPIESNLAAALPAPPVVPLPAWAQILRFDQRQIEFVFRAKRELGDVFAMRPGLPDGQVVTGLPDDARSLFTAKPEDAPSTSAESPLVPILGPDSVLTALGDRHMRQRKLLLPPFHGEAIERYTEAIAAAAEREIDRWPLNRPFALAPRMQAITLDVIMAGIFGIQGRPPAGSTEARLRAATKRFLAMSTWPAYRPFELLNLGRQAPVGFNKLAVWVGERTIYPLIAKRRRDADLTERRDILSLLLLARNEGGEPLSDSEIHSQLVTLILAGHETTANSLAWAWERLVRNPAAHERLLDAVRTETEAAEVIEQTITEAMRSRPVVPLTGRRVEKPWRLGSYAIPASTPVFISILLIHHQESLYPDPFEFCPERWIDRKPGTYEWLPFGGAIRRCLGAALAMAEQRVVLEAMARRLDLVAADPTPEHAVHRNVTMIPARGARVILRSRRPVATVF